MSISANTSDALSALLNDTTALKNRIAEALHSHDSSHPVIRNKLPESGGISSVLFLLGLQKRRKDSRPEPCVIFNKRSSLVKQAGDLCCPGGGVSFRRDIQLARLLLLPGSPLTRWTLWEQWKKNNRDKKKTLALLMATSLRESYEEMLLNPLRTTFMGLLPVQQLGTFGRQICPMVGWTTQQNHFVLNWEVEKLAMIPIRHLLDPGYYARTRFNMDTIPEETDHLNYDDRPCFLYGDGDTTEILWGATFRITQFFLDIVFGFTPPPIQSLPVVKRNLDKNYLTGSRREG